MPDKISIHIVVHGTVQGVGFRYFVESQASRLGLTGFVRNIADGSVEVIGEGEKGKLEALVKRVSQGSELARVTGIDIQWSKNSGQFPSFTIKY
ncbi:MAG: acylphosphatase [Chloroflexi bacterium]|nr:acylphosphatase [Chloroflexota bacterium]